MEATHTACSFSGCRNPKKSLGLCLSHYSQKRRGVSLFPIGSRYSNLGKGCKFEDCSGEAKTKGYCTTHNGQKWRGREMTPVNLARFKYIELTCAKEECANLAKVNYLCVYHYYSARWESLPSTSPSYSPRPNGLPKEKPSYRNADGDKWCNAHKGWLPESQFNRNKYNVDGLQRQCRACRKVYADRTKDSSRSQYLMRAYNMTPQEFEEMFDSQGRRCLICSTDTPNGRHSSWCVDHDHTCCPEAKTCGECVRGIICCRCNRLLGLAKDSQTTLIRAALYLEQSVPNQPLGDHLD